MMSLKNGLFLEKIFFADDVTHDYVVSSKPKVKKIGVIYLCVKFMFYTSTLTKF